MGNSWMFSEDSSTQKLEKRKKDHKVDTSKIKKNWKTVGFVELDQK